LLGVREYPGEIQVVGQEDESMLAGVIADLRILRARRADCGPVNRFMPGVVQMRNSLA
jgi:hypothetical protein